VFFFALCLLPYLGRVLASLAGGIAGRMHLAFADLERFGSVLAGMALGLPRGCIGIFLAGLFSAACLHDSPSVCVRPAGAFAGRVSLYSTFPCALVTTVSGLRIQKTLPRHRAITLVQPDIACSGPRHRPLLPAQRADRGP